MMYGWMTGGWVFMLLLWIAVIGTVVWVASRSFPHGSTQPPGYSSSSDRTKQILDERFARGEIDVTQYHELRDELER